MQGFKTYKRICGTRKRRYRLGAGYNLKAPGWEAWNLT
jgi:hypothetical protein